MPELYILIALELIMISGLTTYIAVMLHALLRKRSTSVDPTLVAQLDAATERLGAAVRHHVDVNAVVEMIRQMDAMDTDALELLKQYPATVQAAAWTHYIDTLGESLVVAQNNLRNNHDWYGANDRMTMSSQQTVDAIRAKLDAAVKASGQTGLRAV